MNLSSLRITGLPGGRLASAEILRRIGSLAFFYLILGISGIFCVFAFYGAVAVLPAKIPLFYLIGTWAVVTTALILLIYSRIAAQKQQEAMSWSPIGAIGVLAAFLLALMAGLVRRIFIG